MKDLSIVTKEADKIFKWYTDYNKWFCFTVGAAGQGVARSTTKSKWAID